MICSRIKHLEPFSSDPMFHPDRERLYLLPIRAAVRRTAGVTAGDVVEIDMAVQGDGAD